MDELKHYGVKGMRWGVIRSKVQTGIKNHKKKMNAKMNAREKASLDKYHEKNKNNKKYQKIYNYHSTRAKTHTTAVRRTRRDMATSSRDTTKLTSLALVTVAPAVISQGAKVASELGKIATHPENVRRGKNVIQALKRSPVRYVNGKAMRNVINP